jgi:hypothetical protein
MVKNELDKHNLKSYISNQYPHSVNLNSVVFLSSHMGTYPIEKNSNFDVCTIIRNPIEARSSYFNFIYNIYLKDRKEYKEIPDYLEKFRYYLFEDHNFLVHNNYQSRFICNPMDERAFDLPGFFNVHQKTMGEKYRAGAGFDWFVPNTNTSIENVMNNLNSFKIVNTLDNMPVFMDRVSKWFEEKYNISIPYDHSVRKNESYTEYDNERYTSADLIASLSEAEKNKVLKLNNIDDEVYNYIKDQEASKND